ncbi:hypothetical protein JW930_05305 [Candidatus Woesearchaeota archaeon]|nr:hypothetical protein [Candidatus Woesearchaeota archaeon]
MELVVDANVLFSALVATTGRTYELIFNERVKLFAPEFLFEEFEEHKDEILEKSGLSETDFRLFLSLVSAEIEIVPKSEFEKHILLAAEVTPDPDDTEYLALAMKLNCPVWSNDKKMKAQNKIKIYNTQELLMVL